MGTHPSAMSVWTLPSGLEFAEASLCLDGVMGAPASPKSDVRAARRAASPLFGVRSCIEASRPAALPPSFRTVLTVMLTTLSSLDMGVAALLRRHRRHGDRWVGGALRRGARVVERRGPVGEGLCTGFLASRDHELSSIPALVGVKEVAVLGSCRGEGCGASVSTHQHIPQQCRLISDKVDGG